MPHPYPPSGIMMSSPIFIHPHCTWMDTCVFATVRIISFVAHYVCRCVSAAAAPQQTPPGCSSGVDRPEDVCLSWDHCAFHEITVFKASLHGFSTAHFLFLFLFTHYRLPHLNLGSINERCDPRQQTKPHFPRGFLLKSCVDLFFLPMISENNGRITPSLFHFAYS